METKADCCDLDKSDDNIFVNNLSNRFSQQRIYTNVAKLLIAINPFKQLNDLYGDEMIKMYDKRSTHSKPHVYGIAAEARKNLIVNNQTIVVCGNSGSGKTETAKHLISFLCNNSNTHTKGKITGSNVLIEAFGNAKTVHNANSSRYVKLIQMNYDDKFERVFSAKISCHSLEISRATENEDHRFHIFEYLSFGAPESLKNDLHIETESSKDMEGKFNEVDLSLSEIGLSEEQKFHIYQILAFITHLVKIDFEQQQEEEGCKLSPKSMQSLKAAARILEISENYFQETLITHNLAIKSSSIKIAHKKCAAIQSKNSLIKLLYDFVFRFVVATINKTILSINDSHRHVAVLDIPGFECFENSKNCFEQFTINYTNEKLQSFWAARLISKEMDLYEKEGMYIPEVKFFENSKILDLFEKRTTGLFSLLDNESKLRGRSVNTFVQNVLMNWENSQVLKSTKNTNCFEINHYSGKVSYDSTKFIEKNAERFSQSVKNTFELATKFLAVENETVTDWKSVCSSVRAQSSQLINQLESNNTQFIRCIKPNSSNTQDMFDETYVVDQLMSSGTFAYYKLMRHGYPLRIDIEEFHKKYEPQLGMNIDAKMLLEVLMLLFGDCEYKFGISMIMMRSDHVFNQLTNFDEGNIQKNVEAVKRKLAARSKWTSVLAATKFYLKFVHNIKKKSLKRKIDDDHNLHEIPKKKIKIDDSSPDVSSPSTNNYDAKKSTGSGIQPNTSSRYDRIDHLPERDNNKSASRCKMELCAHKTHVLCSKCNVHLCFASGRNCFKEYHVQK